MIGRRTDRVYYLKTKQYYPDFLYFATNGYGKDANFNSYSLFLLTRYFYLGRSTGLTYVKSAPELSVSFTMNVENKLQLPVGNKNIARATNTRLPK